MAQKSYIYIYIYIYIYKLKQNSILGKLLNLIIDFLSNRKQQFVLNGKYSSWTNFEAGVQYWDHYFF